METISVPPATTLHHIVPRGERSFLGGGRRGLRHSMGGCGFAWMDRGTGTPGCIPRKPSRNWAHQSEGGSRKRLRMAKEESLAAVGR